jgi:transcriptional regulator with XRE-family HTH domain
MNRSRDPSTGRRWDRAKLARVIGTDPKTVGNWLLREDEEGHAEPGADRLRRLCDTLHVSADFLLGRCEHDCGLTTGDYLIDLDMYEDRRSAKAWYAAVPRRPAIVHASEFKAMKGKKDGNNPKGEG